MFYDNLKAVCDELGLKITPIVLECGGAKGSISNWKKGVSPNSDIVIKLSIRLNVSTDRLLLGKEKNSQTINLSDDEQSLLKMYRLLTEREKGELFGGLREKTKDRME